MCGIAGYSLSTASSLDPLAAARVLIASVAERGADAAGCAYLYEGDIEVCKQPGGASSFLEVVDVPDSVRHMLLHVRDFTKGRPSLMANNHPIRHGSIIGVHNGRITNDEQVFAELGVGRAEPGMTVDSEAIFASLHYEDDIPLALGRLRGSLACGWLDEKRPDRVFLARGYGRPLWIGESVDHQAVMWASTLEALEIAEEHLGLSLHKRPVRPGSILEIADGAIVGIRSFTPDRTATWLVNPIASPEERTACLARIDRSAS